MPPLWPPKREYNAVPAIAGEIWQYRTGGKLTIFNKDHDTAEIAKVLAAKHTASLQLLCTVGGNQARLDARAEYFGALAKGGWKLVVHRAVLWSRYKLKYNILNKVVIKKAIYA